MPSRALAPRMPATMQAELEPRPRAIGMVFFWVMRSPFIGIPSWSYTTRAERYTRLLEPVGMWVPSTEVIWMRSASSKVKTLYIETARPSESKPAPTLALVAGTVTVIIFCSPLFRAAYSASFFIASSTLPPRTSIFLLISSIWAAVAASIRYAA